MSSQHALIIDDNPQNLSVLGRFLTKEGVEHTKVSHPHELAFLLERLGEVDVVFLDLEMPGKDGFEVLQILKATPGFATTPIVAYTVHVSEIDVAYQQGFHSFLGKPLDADRFPGQLARILKGEQVWEAM